MLNLWFGLFLLNLLLFTHLLFLLYWGRLCKFLLNLTGINYIDILNIVFNFLDELTEFIKMWKSEEISNLSQCARIKWAKKTMDRYNMLSIHLFIGILLDPLYFFTKFHLGDCDTFIFLVYVDLDFIYNYLRILNYILIFVLFPCDNFCHFRQTHTYW